MKKVNIYLRIYFTLNYDRIYELSEQRIFYKILLKIYQYLQVEIGK
jgi:hypothetical protein